MSELNSLYISIQISKRELSHFFSLPPKEWQLDSSWLNWWKSREINGNPPLKALPFYATTTARSVFESFLRDKRLVASEHYDEQSEVWTFLSVFFSENYFEILPLLSLLKPLAAFQAPGQRGAVIIYDYYWGSHQIMAFMDFKDQIAVLENYKSTIEIPKSTLQQAAKDLEATLDSLANKNA